jgi:hypothetical protein
MAGRLVVIGVEYLETSDGETETEVEGLVAGYSSKRLLSLANWLTGIRSSEPPEGFLSFCLDLAIPLQSRSLSPLVDSRSGFQESPDLGLWLCSGMVAGIEFAVPMLTLLSLLGLVLNVPTACARVLDVTFEAPAGTQISGCDFGGDSTISRTLSSLRRRER